jgi:hypothetical protein
VICNALPPECSDGDVPSVEGGCWTGICLDPSHCEQATYFGCDECGESEACVDFSWCVGDSCTGVTTCWPYPAGCGEVLDCACGTEALCAGWGYDCYESGARTYCCGGDASTCESAG